MQPNLIRLLPSLLLAIAVALHAGAAGLAEEHAHRATIDSITAQQLGDIVDVLASDVYEGREAGSRGGRAAAHYLVDRLAQLELQPGGIDGGYFQPCQRNYRNILALRPGDDPKLREEYIVVGAHYDHVGFGTWRNSNGPVGFIHNGADDNASGVAALLELAEALASHTSYAARSILLAFWDGEELGLLGSQYWINQPTIPRDQIKLAINVDMVGRLRDRRLEILGSRSGYGLRRLASVAERDPLRLIFNWELKKNGDHWNFIENRVPTLMLHTGLHENYHRPSDDAEHINRDGLERVARYLCQLTLEAANCQALPTFRSHGQFETPASRRHLEQPPPPPLPHRLPFSWRVASAEGVPETQIEVTAVYRSDAIEGPLGVGDRIIAADDISLQSGDHFQWLIQRAPDRLSLRVLRPTEQQEKFEAAVQLSHSPMQLGISWRVDEAEPASVFVTRVVAFSPAARAGVERFDRILEVEKESFLGGEQFQALLTARLRKGSGKFLLHIEREGSRRDILIDLAEPTD